MAFSKTFNYCHLGQNLWLPKIEDSANLPKILHEHSLKNEDT